MKSLIHSIGLALLMGGLHLSASDSPQAHLQDDGIAVGSISEVLPQNAVLHVQFNRLQQVLENVEHFIVSSVPEKLAPEDARQLLQMEHPLLTVLGMQTLQAPITPEAVAERFGLDSMGSASLTLYPGLPNRSFILTLPIANLQALDQFLQQRFEGLDVQADAVGGKRFLRVRLNRPQVPQIVLAASKDRLYISGDESLLLLLYPQNPFPKLAADPFMKQLFETNADNELWAALNPKILKPLLPQLAFFEYVPLNLLLQKRAELLSQIPDQQRAMIEQRLRIDYHIESLEQLADYAECVITATYEEVFDAVISGLQSFNGLAIGANFERGFPQASFYFYSDSIDPDHGIQAIPLADVRTALSRIPGPHHHVSISGKHPAPAPSPRFTSWVARLKKGLESKKLKTDWVDALQRLNEETLRPAGVNTRAAWTLTTREPVNPLRPIESYHSLKEYARDAAWLLAYPPYRPVTVVPSTAGPDVLRETLQAKMDALTKNRELVESLFQPDRTGERLIDHVYRLDSKPLDGGAKQLTWETALITHGGLFGFNQHELISRRFYYTRDLGDYTLFHQASRNADWISHLELNANGAVPAGLTKLLDRVPKGATTVEIHRFLADLPRVIGWFDGFEGVVRREIDAFLEKAGKIASDTQDSEELKKSLADLKFPPLVLSLNRDPGTGELYCLLPGGLAYPRPAIAPLISGVFQEFNQEAEDVGGFLLYSRTAPGLCEASYVQSTEGLSRLIKTVGNAVHDQLLEPDGPAGIMRKIAAERDADPQRFDQILIRNPLWESMPISVSRSQPWQAAPPKTDAEPQHEIPARSADAPDAAVDLSAFYNASLEDSWHVGGLDGNNLAALPRGVQEFAGTKFDVRGIVQLTGKEAESTLSVRFPDRISDIPVHRDCSELHFLHATAWQAPDGTEVAAYVIHYSDGQTEQFPIVYGKHVRDWWTLPDFGDTPESQVGWRGKNPATEASSTVLQLYVTTWKNPRPTETVATVDFVSKRSESAPFLIAITAE